VSAISSREATCRLLSRAISGGSSRGARHAEERQLDGSAAINRAAQRIGLDLGDHDAGEEGDRRNEAHRIERPFAEEIEVERLPVSQLKRQRRAAIQNEFPGNGDEFVPEPPLRGGQHVEARDELGRQCRLVIPTRSPITLRGKPRATARNKCFHPTFAALPARLSGEAKRARRRVRNIIIQLITLLSAAKKNLDAVGCVGWDFARNPPVPRIPLLCDLIPLLFRC